MTWRLFAPEQESIFLTSAMTLTIIQMSWNSSAMHVNSHNVKYEPVKLIERSYMKMNQCYFILKPMVDKPGYHDLIHD